MILKYSNEGFRYLPTLLGNMRLNIRHQRTSAGQTQSLTQLSTQINWAKTQPRVIYANYKKNAQKKIKQCIPLLQEETIDFYLAQSIQLAPQGDALALFL